MIEALAVVSAISARPSSHIVGARFEHCKEVVHSRYNFLKSAVTSFSSITFGTLSCLIKGPK
jgi:hypothetical protein